VAMQARKWLKLVGSFERELFVGFNHGDGKQTCPTLSRLTKAHEFDS
jgi:hypothetical protein